MTAAVGAGEPLRGRWREGRPSRSFSFLASAGLQAAAALLAVLVAGPRVAPRDVLPAPTAGGPVVRVVRVSGEVSWRPAAAAHWRPLGVGAQLGAGDWVRTDSPDSFAELVYIGEAARLWVEAGTLLQIGGAYQALAQVQTERGGLPAFRAAFLRAGRLWVRVVSGLSRLWRFEVHTPTAVAGVRGTLFRLEVTPAGDTWLYVREGAVEFRTARLRVLVKEREAAGTASTGLAPREFTEQSEAGAAQLGGEDRQDDEELERQSEPERLAWLRWLQDELEDELLEDDDLRRALLEEARAARDADRSGLVEWLLGLEKAATTSDDAERAGVDGQQQSSPPEQPGSKAHDDEQHEQEATDEPSYPEGSDSGSGSDTEHPDDSADDDEKTDGNKGGAANGADEGEGRRSRAGR